MVSETEIHVIEWPIHRQYISTEKREDREEDKEGAAKRGGGQ